MPARTSTPHEYLGALLILLGIAFSWSAFNSWMVHCSWVYEPRSCDELRRSVAEALQQPLDSKVRMAGRLTSEALETLAQHGRLTLQPWQRSMFQDRCREYEVTPSDGSLSPLESSPPHFTCAFHGPLIDDPSHAEWSQNLARQTTFLFAPRAYRFPGTRKDEFERRGFFLGIIFVVAGIIAWRQEPLPDLIPPA